MYICTLIFTSAIAIVCKRFAGPGLSVFAVSISTDSLLADIVVVGFFTLKCLDSQYNLNFLTLSEFLLCLTDDNSWLQFLDIDMDLVS